MRRPTTTESETHVVLFTAGFLGRGFDSRRLHHYYLFVIDISNECTSSRVSCARTDAIEMDNPINVGK
jgi:hypothetical protein